MVWCHHLPGAATPVISSGSGFHNRFRIQGAAESGSLLDPDTNTWMDKPSLVYSQVTVACDNKLMFSVADSARLWLGGPTGPAGGAARECPASGESIHSGGGVFFCCWCRCLKVLTRSDSDFYTGCENRKKSSALFEKCRRLIFVFEVKKRPKFLFIESVLYYRVPVIGEFYFMIFLNYIHFQCNLP